ncbi:hypothetical protein C2E23DRAFT_880636 [Lenzites betulinus]|nr:hypothetical protein C2E23DRAFT_880636 [Lenzites betulinus]
MSTTLMYVRESAISLLTNLGGLDVSSFKSLVGLQWSVISGVGAGQSSCQASPVCCTTKMRADSPERGGNTEQRRSASRCIMHNGEQY